MTTNIIIYIMSSNRATPVECVEQDRKRGTEN